MSKNFFEGMGSVLNLFPKNRELNISIPTHSDEEAIFKDWSAVGNDLFAAVDEAQNIYKITDPTIGNKNFDKK